MKQLQSKWNNRRHPKPERKALEAFCRRAAELSGLPDDDWELELLFTNDRSMAGYNMEIVGHQGTTDVITLSWFDDSEGLFPGDPELLLIVNPDAAAREGAERQDSSYSYEMALYIVHGMLHAAGEDDLEDEKRLSMRAAEKRVLAALAKYFSFEELFPEKNK
ncbi:MAG: rRNA maturation RNase YbeY [Lentisphaeria bacterium]|nr:rRNA maturation RNase YbeY [Lentisphaeria bacterium]